MAVTLKLDHPNFSNDKEFGIPGLGRIKNHETLELDDNQVASFEKRKGMTVADVFKNNSMITVSGSQVTQVVASNNETTVTPPFETPSAETGATNEQVEGGGVNG